MYRGQYFEGGRILTGAISAIDIALWDIAGKALDVPLHRLLGGKQRDYVPCFVTTTKPFDESLIADAKNLAEEGWKVIRTTAGEPGSTEHATVLDVQKSIADGASVLAELRKELGNAITIGIDYHHRLTVAETASFCQKMPAGTLDFIEDPIRHQTPEAYETLRQMVDVPFAIGEECASKWDFMRYIEQGITSFARIDVCNVGGISEAMKVAAAAETHYIDIMPHDPLGPVCTAATIQVSAAVPNFAWCEVSTREARASSVDDVDRLFVNPPVEVAGSYAIADAPGHGVDVNEEAVKGQSFEFWEAPRMQKPDGSFTNW